MKKIIDVYGKEQIVDDCNKKLYTYSNQTKKITYNAEILTADGKKTGFFTDYIEQGIVTDISQRLKSFGNLVLLGYAQLVGYDSAKNDPDGKMWDKIVEYVEKNEDKFFKKNGDFRKRLLIDVVSLFGC